LSPSKFGDWSELMPRVAAELAAFAKAPNESML